MKLEKATAPLLLIVSLIGLVGTQGLSESIIVAGSSITAGDSGNTNWLSRSGKFAFGFYREGSGFAVGIQFIPNSSYSTVIWTADRDRQPIHANATLTFRNEGLVVHHVDEGDWTISTLHDSSSPLGHATMLDSGNFVVYDVRNSFVWQTFDNPTDTLMAGQTLYLGKNIISSVAAKDHSSGRFRLELQNRQNLEAVLYPVNTPQTDNNAYWTLNNNVPCPNGSKPRTALNFFDNGISLVSSPDMRPSFARIEADGYLKFYFNQSGSIMVSEQFPSGDNRCLIKGVCGVNSYCNSTGEGKASCFCLPGYVLIDPSRVFAGCQRNFTRGSCEAVDGASTNNSVFYNISRWVNITWPDDSYNSSEVKSEEECRNACFQDCDCYAALFFVTTKICNKQRQPFQYGRAAIGQLDEPTVAFFKFGNTENTNQPSLVSLGIGSLRVLGTLPIALSLLLAATFAVALDLLIFFLCRYRIEMCRRLCESMETGLAKAMAPRFFSYAQLEVATGGYKEKIGEGRYGMVFKGLLPPLDPGTPIAVKKLKNGPGKLEDNFRNELKSIGRVNHRNLVRLLGFCNQGSDWILVYEYLSGGSLADLIFKSHQVSPPSWKQRVGIAMDVARGLLHLHEKCDVTIIHGDIKPENILIGDDGVAKIGDFGLAKHLRPGKYLTKTHQRGTPQYKAPEWASSCVSTKVDVVSFGLLLLELLCVKHYNQPQGLDGEYNLASWAYKCLKGESELQVPGNDVDAKELEEMLKVALWCLVGMPEKRPSMHDVFLMLGRKKGVEFPPVPLLDWNVLANAAQTALGGAHDE